MPVIAEGLRLELLNPSHEADLERFERTNRAFFARRIGDRGDEYFEHFAERLAALVAENRTGTSLITVLVDDAGAIVGRVNLTDIDDPELTELGYRVAEEAQGRGVATRGVGAMLELAAEHGVRTIAARVATTNHASQRVLERCGFARTGPADPPAGSRVGFIGYRRDL